MRISNNHGRFDFNGKDWVVKDDGSRTGIVVNGRPVAKDGTAPLPGESTIVIASILNLATNDIRLGADGQPDALTIRRADNKPELLAAMLLRRLPVGINDPAKGLALPGYNGRAVGTLINKDGRLW